MNLITEYQARHRNGAIPVCHDGVCFFDYGGDPALIVLTSLACRSFATCALCDTAKSPNVIVELFTPGYGGTFGMFGHHHVDPGTELTAFLLGQNLIGYTPYYASKPRDLEGWLWRFCSAGNKMRVKSLETDKGMKIIEQMVYAASKHPKLYSNYYIAYEAFLPTRKYLLFK